MGIKDKVPFDIYLKIKESTNFAENTEFIIMGRAPYSLVKEFSRSCHNHFDNYGSYIPGYYRGITLGDCRELDDLVH